MRPTSLKEAVHPIVGGENWVDAISQSLDEFYSSSPSERQRMMMEEPGLTGVAFRDACVGAGGSTLPVTGGWTTRPAADDSRRFLDRPYCPEHTCSQMPEFGQGRSQGHSSP